MTTIPNSWEEVTTRYQPLPWINQADFETNHMGLWRPPTEYNGWIVEWPFKEIYCNKEVMDDLTWIFVEIINQKVVDSIQTFDGCWCVRPIQGSASGRWSLHSFGIALDLNATTNQLNTVGSMSPMIVNIFKYAGWTWGGDFSRKDPMHFQRAHNC